MNEYVLPLGTIAVNVAGSLTCLSSWYFFSCLEVYLLLQCRFVFLWLSVENVVFLSN